MNRVILGGLLFFARAVFGEVYQLTAYRDYHGTAGIPVLLIGKIDTKSADSSALPRQVMGFDARNIVLSATLDDKATVYPGMKVFVVQREADYLKYKSALIVAEGEIEIIFETTLSRRIAKIKGQFSMVNQSHFIAIPDSARTNESAEDFFLRAERYRHSRDLPRALQFYEHAREKEPNNPLIRLRLAQISSEPHGTSARRHLGVAFENRRRLIDVNEYLTLGKEYFLTEIAYLPENEKALLKSSLALLKSARQYEKDIGLFARDLPPVNSPKFRGKITRFNPEYHRAMGELFLKIAGTLSQRSVATIVQWLEFEERDILYQPIETRINKERKLTLPRKEWDRAYFNAALTHFEIALKKDRQNEAAYPLIVACEAAYDGSDSNRKLELKALIEQYGKIYLEKPRDDMRMGRVRRVLKDTSKDSIFHTEK